MAELKTKPTRKSDEKYLNAVENETRRQDCLDLLKIMQNITGEKPALWGNSIGDITIPFHRRTRSTFPYPIENG